MSKNGEYTSVKNQKWKLKDHDESYSSMIVSKLALPEVVARILSSKKINFEEIGKYLNPTIRHYLPNPHELKDMTKAVNFIFAAIQKGKKIVIFGDYDVDGASSTALLYRFFQEIGVGIDFYIPDRIKEGYGPSEERFLEFSKEKYEIIITVDCGTSSYEPIKLANKLGMKVVVIDHHLSSSGELPEAEAVINPNRSDDVTGLGYLSAAGVVFLFLVALRRKLIEENLFKEEDSPNLLNYLDLVAISTVCDVVPLIGVNRAFVSQGLKYFAKSQNKGLAALAKIASVDMNDLNIYHLGFAFGPRVNAGGRVGKSYYGVKLLTTNCDIEAEKISFELNNYNNERKTIESFILEEAMLKAEEKSANNAILVIKGENWHQGVIGIIAARVKEKYNKPSIIISCSGGFGKASCRSVAHFDMGQAIIAAKNAHLLLAGGGHKMAAGFSIDLDKLPEFEKLMNRLYSENIDNYEDYDVEYFDAYLSSKSVNKELIEKIMIMGPFGAANSEPIFMIKNCSLINFQIMKEKHLSILINCETVGDNHIFRATCFNVINSEIGDNILKMKGKQFNIIGKLKINKWQNRETAEFQLIDLII